MAKTQSKNRWCRWFGHHIETGYGEYFKAHGGAVDGIGRQHIRLTTRCENCNEVVTVGYIHGDEDGKVVWDKK